MPAIIVPLFGTVKGLFLHFADGDCGSLSLHAGNRYSRLYMHTASDAMTLPITILSDMIDELSRAISVWRSAHDSLLGALSEECSGGWLLSPGGSRIDPRTEDGAVLLRHALADLEARGEDQQFRLLGAVVLPAACAPLVLAANQARQRLEEASLPLRRLKLSDLDRRPEGVDLLERYSPLWACLRSSHTIWRPVAAGCGVPRIQIRFAVRPLLTQGASSDLPRKVSFSFARQCISSRRELAITRKAVMAIYRDSAARADAARRDLQRIDALARLRPPAQIAYRYFASDAANINMTWESGARDKFITSLPLFWCGEDIGISMPRARSDERGVRADKKYVDRPVLETLPIYTTALAARELPSLYPAEASG